MEGYEMKSTLFGIRFGVLLLVYCLLSSLAPLIAQDATSGPEVIPAVHHDVSPALRDIPPAIPNGLLHEHPVRPFHPERQLSEQPDGAVQTTQIPQLATITPGLNFDGVGHGFVGPNGAFSVNSAPPDTNAAVGATQVVQWVNESFAVFNKTTGGAVLGPVAGNTLWKGFGGPCETANDGDPIVQYDKAANRWFMAQPVFTAPFMICIAVSTTSDATGTFHRYSFAMNDFPDYPKFGVWPDGYYGTFNMFSGNTFVGARACSFNRTAMLRGASATAVCFQLSSSFGGLLPSDLDGATGPPVGSPNFFLNFGTNSLHLWKFHVNFTTPANSTFTGPTVLNVAAFSEACGGGVCVPQAGTRQLLDSLADRLMYRLAYRNFTTAPAHESLVVNHSVRVSGGGKQTSEVDGVRWYEIRSPNGTPTVFQQGTFSPDSNTRWMGSIAMDKVGHIAVGYSVSSSLIHPAIRFAVRTPTDAAGTLEPETGMIVGTGSQLKNLNRWGDYSSMAIDPVDDCTFWFTTEYLKSSGTFNWSTRLHSFKVSGCQ
jgi:hypothetical protein